MTTIDLQVEMADIKTRLGSLETAVREIVSGRRPSFQAPDIPSSNKELLAWMRMWGLVRDPTPEELDLAAQWDELPQEEQQAVLWELDHLPPGPLASDIIIENRR